MRRRELVGAAVLLLVAVGYFIAAGDINRSALGDEVGAAGVPVVYAATLAGLAVALAVKALVAWRLNGAATRADSSAGSRDSGRKRARAGRAAGMLGIGIAYLAVIVFAGYLLSILAVIALVAVYQGERIGWRLAGISVGGAVLFFVLFDVLLGIDMPPGVWPMFLPSS